MRHHKILTAVAAVLALVATPVGTFATPGVRPPQRTTETTNPVAALATTPYEGLGTWVDMFDTGPWRYPEQAVDKMAGLGVKTLYVQTSNWRRTFAIYKPAKMARLIDRANQHGIQVVAWYLPAFTNLKKDFRRVKEAVDFETEAGNRFDSFALDIEATEVSDIAARNTRSVRLGHRIRNYVGDAYELGAIIPDPAGQRYWPGFAYTETAAIYDVILPMGYYTYRVKGYRATYRYAKRNVKIIRQEAGDETIPIHAIGGIAGRATKREVQAFVDGSRAAGISGISLYDFPITLDWEWRKLTN